MDEANMQGLNAAVEITEQRSQMLDTMKQRVSIKHNLTLHRDSVSVGDVKAMIAHLEAAGMPLEADLDVDQGHGHTRLCAEWSTDEITLAKQEK
jgi:hypothetical protein